MEKLEMKTESISQENIEKIRDLFPNTVTEVKKGGKVTLAVDFDALKQELSDSLIETGQERYQMTWPDKKKSVLLANSAISATLRPCREESVNFDTTQNLYIEGDNLDVLKLLRETYLGKVKMIYIDPPYNTGNDFVYDDDFTIGSDLWDEKSGDYDEQGNRLVKNLDSNGRFHTDWLNMIYPRLKVARDLLTDDGVIFISIDDNEQANLKKICDEVFGENNFVASLIWTNKEGGGSSDSKTYKVKHETVTCFCKNIDKVTIKQDVAVEDSSYTYSDEYFEQRGKYKLIKLNSFSIQYSSSLDYPIISDTGNEIYPSENGKRGCWRWSKNKYEWGKENGFIVIKKGSDGLEKVYTKQYFKVDNEGNKIIRGLPPLALIDKYSSTMATKQIEELLGSHIFDYSKPVLLIAQLLKNVVDKDSLILDFFSGSATTAHAVMQLNAEDGGNRKFIMVQLPEKCDEKSEAYKAGYKNICEIGKERIRRAGKKILEDSNRVDIYLSAISEIVKEKHIITEIKLYVKEVREKWIENEDDPDVQEDVVIKNIIDIINCNDNLFDDVSTYERGGDKLSDLVSRLTQEVTG